MCLLESHLCSIMMWAYSSVNDGLPFVPNQGHYKDGLRKRVREDQAAYPGVVTNERCSHILRQWQSTEV
jgi:hypothetical protein